MSTKPHPNGYIIYRGPSMLDGKPIVAVLGNTHRPSANDKTGKMLQTWILSDVGMKPTDAIKADADYSICGDCKHRGKGKGKQRTCYVNTGQGPRSVYACLYGNNPYPMFDASNDEHLGRLNGKVLRLGSYGDPSAVPFDVWESLVKLVDGRTGYTHQWRQDRYQIFKPLVMASVDTVDEYLKAKSMGWRTFRVRHESEALQDNEITCPASEEAGKRVTCDKCKLCQGAEVRAKDIVIIAHGGIGPKSSYAKRYSAGEFTSLTVNKTAA